jgi:CRP-like cAMP-binding protein
VESRGIAEPTEARDLVVALDGTWFGEGLPPEAQQRLAAIARLRRIAAGTEILREGEIAETLGVLLTGRVALRMLVPERGMVTILTVEPGDVIGWSAVVPPHRSTSTVVAIEDVQILELAGDRLRAALRADPILAATLYPRILQAVSRRLTETRLQLLDLFARESVAGEALRAW